MESLAPAAASNIADLSGIVGMPVERDVSIHRFTLADLEPKGAWLYERMHELYPHIRQEFMASWLRSLIDNNEMLFIASEHAVGLAVITHKPLQIQKSVEEVFVFGMQHEDSMEHMLAVYVAIKRWAVGMDALELIVGTATDVPLKMLQRAIGPVAMKSYYAAKVP